MNYKPTPSDIQWTRALIDQMKDGGVWGIPRCQTVWRFDKTNKILRCIHGSFDAPDNIALRAIAPLIGWTTVYAAENLTPTQVTEAMYGTGKSSSRIANPGVI